MKDLQLNFKTYTKDELDNFDYELNLHNRYVADVDLDKKSIKGVLNSPTQDFPKHTDWYLDVEGLVVKLMFIKNNEGKYKTLDISSEIGVNDHFLYDLLELFVNDDLED